jgi:hypothetical protein
MENLEQMIIYFPRAAKFYSFGNTLEENVVIGKIFDILQNDQTAIENLVDINSYYRLKRSYEFRNPQN